jgi:hypothetical protein
MGTGGEKQRQRQGKKGEAQQATMTLYAEAEVGALNRHQ